ncbi:MAG TPA: TonB family protein [Thermoanaerobaculia bacterium]|nr:TonB family protein [Thermoanaerobaculia bacterium]
MNIREQFGNYLLLKKLGEDPLGETFRAGKVGSRGMEQVVLLRVFNGSGLDGAALGNALAGRRGVQQALNSPNIASGVDLGVVSGVPYVAYDYLSGKNLASLVDQAVKRRNPIPTDHALLIAERMALALAVGFETRHQDDRVLHGCVLPQLVMISNEGETRLLGFEASPALRQLVPRGTGSRVLARYLSPEAREGKPLSKTDDVYSLGMILLEMLVGRPLAPGTEAEYQQLIAQAESQPDATPLPDELKRLLAHSLAPAEKRVGDVISWHKSLSKLMFDGQFSPTTFNLAFFMHNLFRDEIEKESQEIEIEKTMEIPVGFAPPPRAAATPAARGAARDKAAAAAKDLRETTGAGDDTGVIRDKYGIAAEEKGRGRSRILLAAAAALVLIGGAVALFLLRGSGGQAAPPVAEPVAAQPAPVPAVDPLVEAQQKAEAEAEEAKRLEQQLAALVTQQSKSLEERLKKEYDQQIEAMKKELEVARIRAAEAQSAAATPPPAPAATQKKLEMAKGSEPAPVEVPQTAPPPPAAQPAAAAAATQPAAVPASTPPRAQPQPPAQEPAQQAAGERAAPAAAAPPSIRKGELVQLGPGVVPPKLALPPRPQYPAIARRMRKEATVVVRVLVDENGRVSDAALKGEEVGFGLDHEAQKAARGARYTPATKDGVAVKIWWELPIQFKL